MPYPRLNRRQMLAAAAGVALASRGMVAQDEGPIRHGGVPLVALPRLPEQLGDMNSDRWETAWLRTLVYDAPLRALASGAVVASVGIGLGLAVGRDTVEIIARPGVLFAGGAPMTVADIGASIERSIRQAGPIDAWRWDRVQSVDTDADRVRIRLSEPDATLAATLASPLVPVTPGGADVAGMALPQLPPGTGPFVPHRLDGGTAVFRPHRGYWVIGQPRFDGCAVTGVPDVIERTSRLVTGMVDITPAIPALDIPLLRDDPGVKLAGGLSRRLCAVILNHGREPLNDVRVRQLVTGVIDRDALVDAVTAGTGIATASLFSAEHWAGAETPVAEPSVSPDDARDDLAALGMLPGWSLRLICPADQPTLANTAILLQEQLGAAGIALAIDLLDGDAFAAARDAGEFDLMVTLLPTWLDPHEIAHPWLHSAGGRNAGGFASARVDTLLERARRQPGEEVRGALYGEIQRIVADQMPLAPLLELPWVDALRSRVVGYDAHHQPSARGVASAWLAAP
jgi:peptide/nickel transport system substrate-binding protein